MRSLWTVLPLTALTLSFHIPAVSAENPLVVFVDEGRAVSNAGLAKAYKLKEADVRHVQYDRPEVRDSIWPTNTQSFTTFQSRLAGTLRDAGGRSVIIVSDELAAIVTTLALNGGTYRDSLYSSETRVDPLRTAARIAEFMTIEAPWQTFSKPNRMITPNLERPSTVQHWTNLGGPENPPLPNAENLRAWRPNLNVLEEVLDTESSGRQVAELIARAKADVTSDDMIRAAWEAGVNASGQSSDHKPPNPSQPPAPTANAATPNSSSGGGRPNFNDLPLTGSAGAGTLTPPRREPLAVQVGTDRQVLAANDSAQVSAAVSGGVKPYQYSWFLDGNLRPSRTDSVVNAKLSTPGDHEIRVEVTDSADPPQSVNAAVMLTVRTLELDLGADREEMATDESAKVTVRVVGGTPPYSYSWSLDGVPKPARTGPTVTAKLTTPGDHEVKVSVSDSSQPPLTVDGAITLRVTDAIEIGLSADRTELKPGEDIRVSADVSGGVKPYSYEWLVDGVLYPDLASSSMVKRLEKAGTRTITLHVTDSSQPAPREASASLMAEVAQAQAQTQLRFDLPTDDDDVGLPRGPGDGDTPSFEGLNVQAANPPAAPPAPPAIHHQRGPDGNWLPTDPTTGLPVQPQQNTPPRAGTGTVPRASEPIPKHDPYATWVMKQVVVYRDTATGKLVTRVYFTDDFFCEKDKCPDVNAALAEFAKGQFQSRIGSTAYGLFNDPLECIPERIFGKPTNTFSSKAAVVLQDYYAYVAGPLTGLPEAENFLKTVPCR